MLMTISEREPGPVRGSFWPRCSLHRIRNVASELKERAVPSLLTVVVTLELVSAQARLAPLKYNTGIGIPDRYVHGAIGFKRSHDDGEND
jgi:hypothetical protein